MAKGYADLSILLLTIIKMQCIISDCYYVVIFAVNAWLRQSWSCSPCSAVLVPEILVMFMSVSVSEYNVNYAAHRRKLTLLMGCIHWQQYSTYHSHMP